MAAGVVAPILAVLPDLAVRFFTEALRPADIDVLRQLEYFILRVKPWRVGPRKDSLRKSGLSKVNDAIVQGGEDKTMVSYLAYFLPRPWQAVDFVLRPLRVFALGLLWPFKWALKSVVAFLIWCCRGPNAV